MSNGNGHRWSKFWWCDWQNDKSLQACSFAARGLWVELLGLCHGSERPGYLLVNGVPPTINDLADMLGKTTPKEINSLLAELERRRIFSREDGVIYSRRMVRDAAASEIGREHVSKRYQGHNPDPPSRDPSRGANGDARSHPTREPNSQAFRDPNRDPSTKKLEAEAEAERPPVGPHGVGTGAPAQPGTPPARRADGTNPRAVGASPRQTGENPRANGTNGRATGTNPRSRSAGWDECARQRREHWETIEGSAEHVVDLAARRLANG